ncbi:M56 family metallopeptidase [soil metagenome]
MTTAAYLLIYGAVVTWLSPPLLSHLTRRGVSARLGVALWLTAITGALLAWAAAITLIVSTGVGGLPHSSTLVLCLEMLGVPEKVATPGPLSVLLLIAIGLVVSTAVSIKAGRLVLDLRARSREHAHTARLVGQPTGRDDVFVVTADRPAAYCVVGRPNAIVVTSAAVQKLDQRQLAAVLAHENAHISGRHHHLLMVLRALAGALPHLPLFTRGAVAVGELLEMCADDAAARRHGTRPLVAGMIMLAGPQPHLAGGLAVAATAVFVRANRLLDPAHRATRRCHQLLVSTVIAAIVSAPVIVNLLCHH